MYTPIRYTSTAPATDTMTTAHPFLLLGEPLALDLVNTRVHRDGTDVDLLDRPAALDQWLHAERARVDWTGRTGIRELEAICNLRHELDGLLRARLAHRRGPAVSVRALNHALTLPTSGARLAWDSRGPHKAPPRSTARLTALLRQLATNALELLTGPDANRVHKCAHPDCILLFLARNPRRRWCSSATCGNRARVARHYRRAQQTT